MKLAMIEFHTDIGCEDITCIRYIHSTEVCKMQHHSCKIEKYKGTHHSLTFTHQRLSQSKITKI